MNKRKTDIFTVVESVPDWFEASGYTVASPEGSDRVVANQPGLISEGSGIFDAAHYEQVDPTASWARNNPPTWLTATGSCDLLTGWGKGRRTRVQLKPLTQLGLDRWARGQPTLPTETKENSWVESQLVGPTGVTHVQLAQRVNRWLMTW